MRRIRVFQTARPVLVLQRTLGRSVEHEPLEMGVSSDPGRGLVAIEPLSEPLPDVTITVFLEVALSGGAEVLVTGNVRRYPRESRLGCTCYPRRTQTRIELAPSRRSGPMGRVIGADWDDFLSSEDTQAGPVLSCCQRDVARGCGPPAQRSVATVRGLRNVQQNKTA